MEGRLAKFDLKEYARRGAEARVAELRAELAEIYRTFPGLRRGGAAAADGDGSTTGSRRRGAKRRKSARKREMSEAQKRAVSLRMKKYWADRRKAEKAAASAK
jgi:hypothetical protein